MKVYIGVGHGVEPNGVFDPGAVSTVGGVREYDLAFKVVANLAGLLSNRGIDFYLESNAGAGHDPDYRGSAEAVNVADPPYDCCMEVHFDYDQAPRGFMGIYVSDKGAQLCAKISAAMTKLGVPGRGNVQRTDLYFLNATRPPAVIWECDRVGQDVTDNDLMTFATGIAEGLLDYQAFLNGPQPQPEPVPTPVPTPAPEPSPGPPTTPWPGRYLGFHVGYPMMEGDDVREVQQRLANIGYGIGVDGVFGPQTRGIVYDYQRDQGLQQDGIVGPITWGRLFA